MWNPDTGEDIKCPAMEPMCEIIFYNQLPNSDTIHKWIWLQKLAGLTSVSLPMWNPDTGVDTKCPAMKPMCQIMFYNQLPTSDQIQKWTLIPEVGWFHIGVLISVLTNVEPRHWGGHQVSSHGIDV